MPDTSYTYINVAVGLPVNDPFTYKIRREKYYSTLIGRRVLISFRNRALIGYVVEDKIKEPVTDTTKIKEISTVIDDQPILPSALLQLTKWVSDYYMCSWGEAIQSALPQYIKTKKKSLGAITIRNSKRKKELEIEPLKEISLNAEQKRSLESIEEALERKGKKQFLLFGITSSGKTEVYIRSIKKALSLGKSAICLFPEIALTKHLQNYFLYHFKDTLAIVHSRLTQQERFIVWREIFEGKKKVVIGPRSALFAPVEKLGLIIIDEEHENTYKQQEVPRYHTRTVAQKRAEGEGALIVYGGATPSLETMRKVKKGDIELLALKKRVGDRPLPIVKIIDMKNEVRKGKIMLVSQYLKGEIENALKGRDGILLFLNRRGFATHITCLACGSVVECQRCKVALTYHQAERSLVCHYCDGRKEPPDHCPACSSSRLKYGGVGTERIESHVARLFPQARIERFDTDRVRKKGEHERILDAFKRGKIDILIGTQMITKGFDFPHVTLVGVINADTVLSLPDFRSTERTFQLLMQVAGRAGRGEREGKVVIQTFSPNHYAIRTAAQHDYESFYNEEIKRRQELNYPPFSDLINIIIRSKDEKQVRSFSVRVKELLEPIVKKWELELMGPAPLPFYHLRGYFRWHIMMKGTLSLAMITEIRSLFQNIKKKKNCQYAFDVEPVNIL